MVMAPTAPALPAGGVSGATKPRATELLAQMSPRLYSEAYDRGLSLSAWLETQDPSTEYPHDGLDAFGRILKVTNIRTQSVPEWGVWADEMDAFLQNDATRMLVPEWAARTWRATKNGRPATTRALYTSTDNVPGGAANLWYNAEPVITPIIPVIPLNQVVARTVGLRSSLYRAFYLTDVTAQERMVRVSEGAEIPRVTLKGGDHTTQLHKTGRILEVSYEQMRRQQIDVMALHIQQLAAQTEADKVTAAMDILINGDGNASTAATNFNLTTLDAAASAGTLTLKGWLAFKMKFNPPFTMTTALAQTDVALQMQLLNTGTANIPLVAINAQENFGGFTAINPNLRDNVALGWTADAPSLKVVGFDRRFSLLYLTEIGADIQEVVRFAERQVQGLVMTEVDGFVVLNPKATLTLNVNA